MNSIPDCPQCRRPMIRGYFVDHGYGTLYPTAWAEGAPRWRKWLGLKIRNTDKVPVAVFRCERCGKLESYAWHGEWPG